MPKYCKCKLTSKSWLYKADGTSESWENYDKFRASLNNTAFLYPNSTIIINGYKFYALVKPGAHGLNASKKYWVYPGGTWIDKDKYQKAELFSVPSSGYTCYESKSMNSHKVYSLIQSATSFNNYQVMVLAHEGGWYELLWPELWGKNSKGYFKKATESSPVSSEGDTSSSSGYSDSTNITGSSGVTELTGSEELVLTEAELKEIDSIISSGLSNSLNHESLFGVNYMVGSPFQFLPSADHRIYEVSDRDLTIGNTTQYKSYNNYKLGRSYTENIIVEAPIVYFLPGEPSFMAGFDNAQKDTMSTYISNRLEDADMTKSFDELLTAYGGNTDFGRFYDFKGKYSEYMRYVNLLCRAAAIFIGIGDKTVPNQPSNDMTNFEGDNTYKYYDWRKWGRTVSYNEIISSEARDDVVNTQFGIFNIIGSTAMAGSLGILQHLPTSEGSIGEVVGEGVKELSSIATNIIGSLSESASEFVDNLIGDDGYFKCYMDPSSSASEDVSNTTRSSQIASLFDNVQDLYKEAEYLIQDSGVLSELADTLTGALSSVTASAGSVASNIGFGNFGKILGMGSQVLQGANVVFPEMWGDSEYSRQYTITINLVSPYGDTESIFLNTIMPMMHLIALGLPRQTSPNSFASPFIVRAFSPGIFSCDLGLVTSITINKCPNGTDAYNVMGLPSEVQVQLTIKDLYSALSMTSTQHPLLFYNNQGLIDFLGVVCGLNFAEPTIFVRLKALWSIIKSMVLDIPDEVYYDVINNLSNATRGLMGMK